MHRGGGWRLTRLAERPCKCDLCECFAEHVHVCRIQSSGLLPFCRSRMQRGWALGVSAVFYCMPACKLEASRRDEKRFPEAQLAGSTCFNWIHYSRILLLEYACTEYGELMSCVTRPSWPVPLLYTAETTAIRH